MAVASSASPINPEQLAQTLSQMRPLQLPLEPSWWPPALAWWLALLAVLACLAGIYLLWRRYRGPLWYRQAQNILQEIRDQLSTASADNYVQAQNQAITQMNRLLKRVALTLYSRDSIASLTGDQWCKWLDQQTRARFFTQGHGRVFADYQYTSAQSGQQIKPNAVFKGVKRWLKKHKSKTPKHNSLTTQDSVTSSSEDKSQAIHS